MSSLTAAASAFFGLQLRIFVEGESRTARPNFRGERGCWGPRRQLLESSMPGGLAAFLIHGRLCFSDDLSEMVMEVEDGEATACVAIP